MSSKGSVVAEFQLMFRTSVLFYDVFIALKSKIGDGDLGSLRVDPKSLEQINRPTQGILFLYNIQLKN